jgi:hypothetical protein
MIINFYENNSHSILPNFKKILDFIEVLKIEGDEEEFLKFLKKYERDHQLLGKEDEK